MALAHFIQWNIRVAAAIIIAMFFALQLHALHHERTMDQFMTTSSCAPLCTIIAESKFQNIISRSSLAFTSIVRIMFMAMFGISSIILPAVLLLPPALPQRLRHELRHRWKWKLFSPWTMLFQRGIVAARLYE